MQNRDTNEHVNSDNPSTVGNPISKADLYNRQISMLRTFLAKGAISQAQYNKSAGDLARRWNFLSERHSRIKIEWSYCMGLKEWFERLQHSSKPQYLSIYEHWCLSLIKLLWTPPKCNGILSSSIIQISKTE